jgi:flagellar hook-associated protein 1 FlgK
MSTAVSALCTQQAAIDVTSTNIANADTDGYSRQEVVIVSKDSISTSYGQVGTGVSATEVERVCDSFVTEQIISENQDLGKWDVEKDYLASIETIFTESESYGLSEAMSEFWNSWQDLVNDPSGSTERSVLISQAEILADTFNSMSSDLSKIQHGVDDDISGTVDEINEIVQQIVDLNQKIAQIETTGQNANTYEDSLDSLVSELATLIDITTYENDNGQTCIQTANGKPLVEGTTTWSLSVQVNSDNGLNDVCWEDSSGVTDVITEDISGGELGGLLEVRDDLIPAYQEQSDELAIAIMDEINALHTSGYDANGESGAVFFTGTGAADMAVNSDLINDPDGIAASADADSAPGDSTNAVAIADLQNALVMDDGTTTFSEYYAALVTEIGTTVRSAESNYEYQEQMVKYYEDYRESISGVSLDEESANLILYQNAYEAAAQIITVLDELMETIISM